MPIYPVPTGRSSDALLTQRLLAQLQDEQKSMLDVEQQLGTGRRFQLPSTDPPAATRAITLQRLLEQKTQLHHNLSMGQSYLDATDTSLSGVSDLMNKARSQALIAADGTTSDSERDALAVELQATIDEMLRVGNESFRGQYLFAGTESRQAPFEVAGNYVAYRGNNSNYRMLADKQLLYETNISGHEIFGAVSRESRGVDLNPVLTPEVRLSDLHGGQGINAGTIELSDGTNSSTISLSSASTLQDVVRAIEANPPEGRKVHATIGAEGIVIKMDDGAGGNLIVRDVQEGTTAADLGIARAAGSASEPIVGGDLDPALKPATPLENILGTRAQTYLRSEGPNSDILLEARDRGPEGNGYQVQFVDDDKLQAASGLTAGYEYAELDSSPRAARAALPLSGPDNDLILTANSPGTEWNNVRIEIDASNDIGDAANVAFEPSSNRLLVEIDDTDQTTLGTLVAAINASGEFTASADSSRGEGYNPAGQVLAADAGVRGDTGNSGGEADTIYVNVDAGHTSANQVLEALRSDSQIDALFDARLDPLDSENSTGAGAGTVDLDAGDITSGGGGIEWDQDSGLQVTNGGETHLLDVSGAETVEDLLNVFNGSDAMLMAHINGDRTGINVRSRLSGADLSIGENGGTTATDLGLRTLARTTPLGDLNYRQGVSPVSGADFVVHRNDGTDLEIDVSSERTIGDVIDLINEHPDNQNPDTRVVAGLQAYGNGIELVDDNPDTDESLTVSRTNRSEVAWELGLVPSGEDSSQPVDPPAEHAEATVSFPPPHATDTAFRVDAARAGTEFNGVDIVLTDTGTVSGDNANVTFDPVAGQLTIDLDEGDTTTNTVVSAINAEGTFTAATTSGSDGSGPPPASGVAGITANGTPETLAGEDPNPIETEGVFNTLLRLQDAVESHDVEKLGRIVQMFDDDLNRLNMGRAIVGISSRSMDTIQVRNEDEQVELKEVLSEEIDVDLAEAVSEFSARQAGYEASLRAIGNMYHLSLLDFL